MGHIHFIRSGGVRQAGKTVLASMLMEYLRMHQIPAYYIDPQENPKMGLYYSPAQNTGKSRICFDHRDITRADQMVELSFDAEIIVDLPANMEDVANEWISGIIELVQSETIKALDWFIFTYSTAAWETHLRQVAFWKNLDVEVIQFFFLPTHLPLTPNCLPWNFREICLENMIPHILLPAPEGVKLDDRPICEIIDTARYPHNLSLQKWQQEMFGFFKKTKLFKEQERLAPEYKANMHPLELLKIAKAHMFQNNLQPQKEPGQKTEAEKPFPW